MNQIEQIELSMEAAKKKVELGQAMERLLKHRDFKKVFSTGYQREYAIRLVSLLADPGLAYDEKAKEYTHTQLLAISAFEQHINSILQEASNADRSIRASEEELDLARQEADLAEEV